MAGEGFYGITVADNEALDETLTVRSSDGVTATDLTGYTAKCDVRTLTGSLALRFHTTPGAGEGTLTLGGTAGTVRFFAAYALIDTLAPGYYYFDLLLYNASGTPSNPVRGTFVVTAGVSAQFSGTVPVGDYASDPWKVFGPIWTGRA